jgi:hypothetical protein
MINLCVIDTNTGHIYARENEQRLLRNMDVHVVVLELLKIPYEKVDMFMFHRCRTCSFVRSILHFFRLKTHE